MPLGDGREALVDDDSRSRSRCRERTAITDARRAIIGIWRVNRDCVKERNGLSLAVARIDDDVRVLAKSSAAWILGVTSDEDA